MSIHFWLRAESKPHERRTPVPPESAQALLDAGHRLTVEADPNRIFDLDRYPPCEHAAAGEWRNAPADAVILGLKELPDEPTPLRHRHVFFAHAFKEQRGWRDILRRFADGDGVLFDLEFLTESSGRRVAAFGYWAGYVGAVLGVEHVLARRLGMSLTLQPPYSYPDRTALEARATRHPGSVKSAIVIGARGRSGRGAMDALHRLGVANPTGWDRDETAAGGPFDAILEHELLVNCVLLGLEIPPFVTEAQLQASKEKTLKVISDVSCDPTSPHNPIPIYEAITTVEAPVRETNAGVDMIAIDHLPSLLPKESSEDFGSQLLPHLLAFDSDENAVWSRAQTVFRDRLSSL